MITRILKHKMPPVESFDRLWRPVGLKWIAYTCTFFAFEPIDTGEEQMTQHNTDTHTQLQQRGGRRNDWGQVFVAFPQCQKRLARRRHEWELGTYLPPPPKNETGKSDESQDGRLYSRGIKNCRGYGKKMMGEAGAAWIWRHAGFPSGHPAIVCGNKECSRFLREAAGSILSQKLKIRGDSKGGYGKDSRRSRLPVKGTGWWLRKKPCR